MNKIKDTTEYQFYQFRVPRLLWKKLKHNAIENDKTANETLIDLVERHVK